MAAKKRKPPGYKPVSEMAEGEIRVDEFGNPTHIKKGSRLVMAPGHKLASKQRVSRGLPRFSTAVRRLMDDGLDIEAAVAQAVLAVLAKAQSGDVQAFEAIMHRLDPDTIQGGKAAGGNVQIVVQTGVPEPIQTPSATELSVEIGAPVTTTFDDSQVPASIEDLL